MMDKISNLIENKDFVIPRLLLCNLTKLNILYDELVIIIYLINVDKYYDPEGIAQDLNIDVETVVTTVSNLCDKDIVKINMEKQGTLNIEKISLKPLYKKLSMLLVEPEKTNNKDLYSTFEASFGRALSPIEYEIIGKWQETKSEDLIVLALKETINRGITSVKYIDKILVEWEKKGFKTIEDVSRDRISKNEKIEVD